MDKKATHPKQSKWMNKRTVDATEGLGGFHLVHHDVSAVSPRRSLYTLVPAYATMITLDEQKCSVLTINITFSIPPTTTIQIPCREQ